MQGVAAKNDASYDLSSAVRVGGGYGLAGLGQPPPARSARFRWPPASAIRLVLRTSMIGTV
jgi:hypothetical protein